ncbi:MAG: PAS domain S-box protein [Acidimicrobiales bacterium]
MTGVDASPRAAERLREGLCLVDADGRATYVSPGIEALFGVPADAIVGQAPTAAVFDADKLLAADAWGRVVAEPGAQARVEFRVPDRGGELRWVEVVGTNLLDEPRVGAVVVTVRDITERRTSEDSLHAGESVLHTIVRNTTDCLVLVDPQGRVRWGNPAIQEVLGTSPLRWIGHHLLQFVHPDDVADFLPSLRRVLTGHDLDGELVLRVRHGDGSWRSMEATARPVADDRDDPGAMFSLRDVTDRVAAERALRASQARLAAVVDASPDVIAIVDAEARVEWISATVTTILGHDADELVGCTAFDLVSPDDLDEVLPRFLAVSAEPGTHEPMLLHVRHADGSIVPVEGLGTLLPGDGDEPDSILVSVRDVRARLEAEEALRRRDERFRALVQHSADAIVVIDGEAAITYASPAAEAIFGQPPTERQVDSALDFIHPDDQEWAAEEFLALMATPAAVTTRRLRVRHHPDGFRWVEATVVNRFGDPAVDGLVANIRDITDRMATEEALRRSEARFRTVVQGSYDAVVVVDREGSIMWVTESSERMLGWTPDDLVGVNGLDLIHPDDVDLIAAELASFVAGTGVPVPTTIKLKHKDGSWHHVEIVGTDMLDHPDIGGIALNARLVDDRVAAERQLRRLIDIFELTRDLVAIADARGNIEYLNAAARRFFGVDDDVELGDLSLGTSFTPASLDRLRTEVMPSVTATGTWSGELDAVRADGEVVAMLAQMIAHLDDGRLEFVSAVFRDITERKAFERRLEHEATHDPLTGLPNRTLLLDRLDLALARSRRRGRGVGVLFCDLDHFKVVNDSLGHSAGDRLLVDVADRLQHQLRPGDTVSRFGGDEFVILCEDVDGPDPAVRLAERVEEAMAAPFRLGEEDLHLGVSIGIAIGEPGTGDPEALIRDADAAMYRAKAKGRQRHQVFEVDMWEQAVDRLDLENALRRALGRGELELRYQPIVDLRTGLVDGVEALLRWRHPQRGLLAPDEFIGVAEETGVIVSMGDWVLTEACCQLVGWDEQRGDGSEGPPLTMAVNLSGRQLDHPDLVGHVQRALETSGLAADRLHLEITESELMDDVEGSQATLEQLRSLGVHLAVDDFGTGYSSLSYLKRFPVDRLKVDRSFVDGLGTDPEDTAIVTAIVRLAHSLGLEATAEGVETEAQRTALADLGCDRAQGYLLATPLPADEVLAAIDRTG